MPKTDLVPISVHRIQAVVEIHARLAALANYRVYLGIPPTSKTARKREIREARDKIKRRGPKSLQKRAAYNKAIREAVLSNADLLYLFEKGNPRYNRPPRSVLRASLADRRNKEEVSKIYKAAAQAGLAGNSHLMRQRLEMVGKLCVKNAKDWFYSPRNNWPPNAPRTIREKGFDQPGIEVGIMREAITYYIKRIEEKKEDDKPKPQPKTDISRLEFQKQFNRIRKVPKEGTEAVEIEEAISKEKRKTDSVGEEAENAAENVEGAAETAAEAAGEAVEGGAAFGAGEIEGLLGLL